MANFNKDREIKNDEEIELLIKEESEKLNECFQTWYKENFPDELEKKEFVGCCNEDELNLLVKCYNIFSKNNELTHIDKDFIKALLVYYYNIVVLENYVHNYLDEKYESINEETEDIKDINKYFSSKTIMFISNKDGIKNNTYVYQTTIVKDGSDSEDEKKYIEIKNPFTNDIYYVNNVNRVKDPYIYKDEKGTKKIELNTHINCFDKLIENDKKRRSYYKLFYESDNDWISEIRKKMMGFNDTEFKGGKLIIKKNSKKSRKNKGKKKKTTIKFRK